MKKITTVDGLKEAILELEIKKNSEETALKEEFNRIREQLKPANLIQNTLKEISVSPSIRGNILTTAIGLAAGYLTKKMLFGSTHNPIKKLAGTLLQFGVAGTAPGIKAVGENLLKRIFRKSKKEVTEDTGSANNKMQH